jgi:hypothetical protein
MNIETLKGITRTADCMDIDVSVDTEGMTFVLSKGRHTCAGLVPWHLLEESCDPHGLCACTMGDIFRAMEIAKGVDEPRVVRPSHWSGTGRAGNGGDM